MKEMPPAAEVNALLALHTAHRYAEAESRTRALLGQYPDFGFGWKLLGSVLQAQGKDALPAFQKVTHLQPDDAEAHYNLGVIHKSKDQLNQAATSYQRAIKLKPDYAEAHSNLGNTLKDLGRLDAAITHYRRALKIQPHSADTHNNLGTALKDLGTLNKNPTQLDAALASYRQAVTLKPDFALAYYNLGNAQKERGQLDDAVSSYRRAIEIKPDFAQAHSNLSAVLKDAGQYESALEICQRAVAFKPDSAEAHYNLGNVQKDRGQFGDAAASYRRAVEIKPDYAQAHNNLGTILKALGQLNAAMTCYRRAVELKPDSAVAHSNFGDVLRDLGQFDEAEASCRKAIEIDPSYAEAHNNLGTVLKDMYAAVVSYRRAVELNPDFAMAHYNLGNTLRDLGNLNGAEASYRRALEIKPDYNNAYSNLIYMHAFTRHISPELERNLAINWENAILNESERTAARQRAFDYLPRAGRKLKVGIVSAELGQHAVAEFLEPLLEQLDRRLFHVTLYPTATRLEPRAERLRKLADEYKSLIGISDNKAAELIRSDRIDILIDTTGHMSGCRLGIFAHRAAPVQCHYIGYHGTTGLTEMDWFIADEILLPASFDSHFREKIWRLPRLRLSYRGDVSLSTSNWKPDPDGIIWLGSFNNLTKVREEALGLWAKVMNAIPESRLLLKDRKAADLVIQQRIRTELARHGISHERIEFVGHVPDWKSHMALYDRLDIALDTIPLNSETTAFDALWMGVPLIALEGSWYGGRMASTILKALGKPHWVAQNENEYVAIVVALARNVESRISLRKAQRALMANSSLCDAKELARVLEDAFEKMFDRWMEECRSAQRQSGTNE
jgi:protein O-GlcNAc transferase